VLRVYIPKADGGKRALGLPALEDKLVQSAVAEVLNAIYEADFYGFSYGFRPGRSPHGALASLEKAVMTQRVNWVLDVDIRTFFDSLDHEWLVRMLKHRIADRRIIRLIERWLKAGILESGEWTAVETGSPQGSGISPILANVFLHYAFDAWIHQWRQRYARGRIVVVRYADDGVIGAEYESDAQNLLAALRERLAKFGLALNEGKTRLIEFGRFAAQRRAKAGLRRPETFDFLGFTHYCGETRRGRFMVKRKTQAKRMVRKLKELRVEMRKRWHVQVPEQYTWLSQVLRGHYGYYGLIFNYRSLNQFYQLVKRMWFKALTRRSQTSKLNWNKFSRLLMVFPLPKPTTRQSWYGAAG
jgi:group II intron reverse transcriptase/maturase